MNGLFGQGGPSPEVLQRLKMLMMLKQQNPALFQQIMQAQQNQGAPQQALPRGMPAQSPFAAFGAPPMMNAQGMFTPPGRPQMPVPPAQPVPPGQFARFAPPQAEAAMPKNFTPYNVAQVPQAAQGLGQAQPQQPMQGMRQQAPVKGLFS